MRTSLFGSVALASFLIYTLSCANNENGAGNISDVDTTGQPVETKKPNSNYKPAFPGQTRVKSIKTTTAYQADKIAEKLESPWAVTPLPDGRLLITEKKGYISIRDANGTLVKKFTGIPAVDSRGQGGLLDIAIDPDFKNNKMVYWSFSEKQNSGNLMAVAKGKLDETSGTIQQATVIFRATPALNSTLHFGSRIVFAKDGNMFVSTGERSILEGRAQAQLLESSLGKIFKITKEGKPAPGNPFLNNPGAIPQIYAYGIRNCQSLDIHPVTGEIWEAEFGPRGGDEVNVIKAGNNYGWPVITYGLEYSGQPIGTPIQQKAGMEQPVYYWDPVVSPSGMSFYAGNAIPEWKNNLFIGALSGQHIIRLVIDKHKITGEERLLQELNERFRDVAYSNGMLYAITDQGNLYRIHKK